MGEFGGHSGLSATEIQKTHFIWTLLSTIIAFHQLQKVESTIDRGISKRNSPVLSFWNGRKWSLIPYQKGEMINCHVWFMLVVALFRSIHTHLINTRTIAIQIERATKRYYLHCKRLQPGAWLIPILYCLSFRICASHIDTCGDFVKTSSCSLLKTRKTLERSL